MTQCVLCASAPAALTRLAPGDDEALLCPVCAAALSGDITPGPRWRCLGDAIWAAEAPTQIAAYRLLKALPGEAWAADLLETVYLDPEVLERAEAGLAGDDAAVIHRDSNGALLASGELGRSDQGSAGQRQFHGGQARHGGAQYPVGA